MALDDTEPLIFGGGRAVPIAVYLLAVATVTGLLAVTEAGGPVKPVVGTALGVFYVVLTAAAFRAEGLALRDVLPSIRSAGRAVAVVAAFWALYNLAIYGLTVVGIGGLEPAASRAVGHPIAYSLALLSSLLFTALPEELLFRGYLQQKFVALAGGLSGRPRATGVAVATALFALFHLPRLFLHSGYGLGPALAVRIAALVAAGLAFGVAYELTRNLWLVALFHATMNQPPWLVRPDVLAGVHSVVVFAEYAAIVGAVVLYRRVGGRSEPAGRGRVPESDTEDSGSS